MQNGTDTWVVDGDAIITNSILHLTGSGPNQVGFAWRSAPNSLEKFELTFTAILGCKSGSESDGFAFWYSTPTNAKGQVFGHINKWNGLGIFFTPYAKQSRQNRAHLSVIINDGTQKYDFDHDGDTQSVGSAQFPFSCGEGATSFQVKVIYMDGTLWVLTTLPLLPSDGTSFALPPSHSSLEAWNTVCYVEDIDLGVDRTFGFSAMSQTADASVCAIVQMDVSTPSFPSLPYVHGAQPWYTDQPPPEDTSLPRLHSVAAATPDNTPPALPSSIPANSAPYTPSAQAEDKALAELDSAPLTQTRSLLTPLQLILSEAGVLSKQITQLSGAIDAKAEQAQPEQLTEQTSSSSLGTVEQILHKLDKRRKRDRIPVPKDIQTQTEDVCTHGDFEKALARMRAASQDEHTQQREGLLADLPAMVDYALAGAFSVTPPPPAMGASSINDSIAAFRAQQRSDLQPFGALRERHRRFRTQLAEATRTATQQLKAQMAKDEKIPTRAEVVKELRTEEAKLVQSRMPDINTHVSQAVDTSMDLVRRKMSIAFSSAKQEINLGGVETAAKHQNSQNSFTASIYETLNSTRTATSWLFFRIVFALEIVLGLVFLAFSSVPRKSV